MESTLFAPPQHIRFVSIPCSFKCAMCPDNYNSGVNICSCFTLQLQLQEKIEIMCNGEMLVTK